MELRGFYFITDRRLSTKSDAEAALDAIEAGARVVQYREKELGSLEMIEIAQRIRELSQGKALLIINDRVDVAFAVDADGMHLGQDDMSVFEARRILGRGKIIGLTVHTIDEALAAQENGADYVAVSPIFATLTKEDAGKPAGLKLVRDVKARVKIPVAAIGGINETNVDEVISAGADMVCAISATVCKRDIKAAVKFFVDKFS